MELRLSQHHLARALKTVERAVAVRTTIPALTGILLTATEEWLHLRATDLELSVETALPAAVTTPGSVALPGRHLTELVRHLAGGEVTLQLQPDNWTVRLSAGDTNLSLHGVSPEQFPAPPQPKGPALVAATGALRRCLRETGFALGSDPARPWFTGVFMTVQGRQLVALSTDNAILACSGIAVHNPEETACSVILPGRSVQELSRLLGETEAEEVSIYPDHAQLTVQLGAVRVSSRLLEGQYPDFRRILPPTYPASFTADRAQLSAACERVALLAKEGRMRLEGSPEGLSLSGHAPAVGWLSDRVPGALIGEPFQTQVNVRYLLQGLRHQVANQVALDFSGPRTALRVRPVGESREVFFAVMPLIEF